MAFGDGITLAEQRLTARATADGVTSFDPITIILAIISALSGICPTPTPASLRTPGPFQRAYLTLSIRRKTGMSIADSRAAADRAISLAGQATDPELQSFIDDLNEKTVKGEQPPAIT